MKNKKMLLTAVIGLIISLLAPMISATEKPIAGKGNGEDDRITSLSQLSEFLTYAKYANDAIESPSISLMSNYSLATNHNRYEEDRAPSFTLEAEANLTGSESSSDFNINGKQKLFFEYGKFYAEQKFFGGVSASTGYRNSEKTRYNVGRKIYIDNRECLLFYDRYNYQYKFKHNDVENPENNYTDTEKTTKLGQNISVIQKYLNQWIDCSDDRSMVYELDAYKNTFIELISSLNEMIKEEINAPREQKLFTQSNGVYLLDFDKIPEEIGYKIGGYFKIDLSKKNVPVIDCDLSVETPSSKSYLKSNKIHCALILRFKNINNTKIEFKNVKTVDVGELLDQMEI